MVVTKTTCSYLFVCPCCFQSYTVEQGGKMPSRRSIDRMVCDQCRADVRMCREERARLGVRAS